MPKPPTTERDGRFIITTKRNDGTPGHTYSFHSAGSGFFWLATVLAEVTRKDIQSFTLAVDE